MADPEKVITYIDQIKKDGWRPCIICAIVARNKMALFKSNKYPGYEFLQGGIEFGEQPEESFERELIEELGYQFYTECSLPPTEFKYLFEDRMKTKVKDAVLTIDGQKIHPQGKHYIVFAVIVEPKGEDLPKTNEEDSRFSGTTVKLHTVKWVSSTQGKELIRSIENPKKREIASRIIDLLKEKGLCN